MNVYAKWGRNFLNSLIRHLGTSMACYFGMEFKYQEVNFRDLGLFLLCGAVIPTVTEFLKEGLPPAETNNENKP